MAIMKSILYAKQETTAKIVFVFLALLLSGLLFVSESIASESCKQYDGTPALCNACCNPENAQNHCRNICLFLFNLPKIALVSNGTLSDSLSITTNPGEIDDWTPDSGRKPFFLCIEKTYTSTPIFLQNESFLI